MSNPTTFNKTEILKEIREKEDQLQRLLAEYNNTEYKLKELRRINAANTTIQWKESIKNCLDYSLENENKNYFLRTPAFVATCVAYKYGVELTRDIKNKISTTLSIMFHQSAIGRMQHNG